jgi:hypothetical protein
LEVALENSQGYVAGGGRHDSFRNRVYRRPIPLCPAGNEGMSEGEAINTRFRSAEGIYKAKA